MHFSSLWFGNLVSTNYSIHSDACGLFLLGTLWWLDGTSQACYTPVQDGFLDELPQSFNDVQVRQIRLFAQIIPYKVKWKSRGKLIKKRLNHYVFSPFPLVILSRNYYLTSIVFTACSTGAFPVFGISMDKMPFSILAEIFSFSTLPGKRMACWNFE